MSVEREGFKYNRLLLSGIGLISIIVFIIDIYIPLGVSGGVVYVLFVMATYWTEGRRITLIAGLLATILLFAGFVVSITSAYVLLSAANHLLMIIVIWASAVFVNRYKDSLHLLRENYRTLFQVATDEILVFQLDDDNQPQTFLEINDAACNILGYSKEELLQKKVYDISADKVRVKKNFQEVIEKGEAVFESRHLTKTGEVIPLELSVRSFTYNGRQTIISSGRDLRERRKLEREILAISETERQRIGQDMHDDLGQLLTVALLSAQQLNNVIEDEQLATNAKEVVNLIKQVSESTRTLSHGLVPVNLGSHGLDKALSELTFNTSKIHNVDIKFTSTQDDAVKLADYRAVHLYRIAQEAINNAIKHAKASSIEVRLSFSESQLTLQVKDNGIGLPDAEEQDDGVGLRIMRFRTNLMDGDLRIKSERGKGTEITCQIPLD
ncbi:MAG: PAS domain-containing sensor histidine kinase [Balneolaceae bacterium]